MVAVKINMILIHDNNIGFGKQFVLYSISGIRG